MDIRPETEKFLSEVERFAQRKFFYHKEIATLIECAEINKVQNILEEIIFFAKFITKAHEILERQGVSADETQKLSEEYSASLVKTTKLIQNLTRNASADIRETFERKFLSMTHESMENFISMLKELSWLKNYAVDKKA